MSYKVMNHLALISAMMLAASKHYFDTGNKRRVEEKKESQEDRERRERCEQMAIEEAKAKRERKAAKLRLNTKKEG